MHVSSYPRGVAWLPLMTLILAGFAGGAQAVEFDERVKAPMARTGVELKAQAESYSASFARLSNTSPMELATNKALAQEHYELKWQLERALEDKRPLEDLSAMGLVKEGNGFQIDLDAFPQWIPFPEKLATLMPVMSKNSVGPLLISRGFRDSDVVTLWNYVETHDLKAATSARTLPMAISFSKVVKKYDKIKKPVGKDAVLSFLYQRGKVEAEVQRAWAEGLVHSLDDQRVRVLHSFISEYHATGHWSPDDVSVGVESLLTLMRLPDYEQRATAAATGATP